MISLCLKRKTGFCQDGHPVEGTNLVVVVLEPLNGLLVANPLEGFLGRLEVGVELSDQVAQGMLQHSARKLGLISSRKSMLWSIADQAIVSSRKSVRTWVFYEVLMNCNKGGPAAKNLIAKIPAS